MLLAATLGTTALAPGSIPRGADTFSTVLVGRDIPNGHGVNSRGHEWPKILIGAEESQAAEHMEAHHDRHGETC